MAFSGIFARVKRAICLGLIAWLCTTPARAADRGDWHAAVGSLLSSRASAVAGGERAAFDATMAGAPASFRAAKGAWFARIRSLPLASYTLEVAHDGYDDLRWALRVLPSGDEVHVVEVRQHLRLRGYDARPTSDDLYLTVVRTGTQWSVVSDSDLEDLGLESAREVWDFGAITQVVHEGVLVLSHDDARASTIATSTATAAARVHRSWPLRWKEPIVCAIPASRAELQRILAVTFDLGPFVAFTSSSLDRMNAGYRLTGHRIYVQPANFFNDSSAYRDDTLGHELTHLATRSLAGIFTPTWLDEGIAQVYGQRTVLKALPRGEARLPEDREFTVGSADEIDLAYARAANFISWMRARFGNLAPARLYQAVGSESAVSFGTRRYHLDRASRTALGMPLDAVVRAWQRAEGT